MFTILAPTQRSVFQLILVHFDIGVFSKEGLSTKEFLKLFKFKDEFEDHSAYLVDLVNLNVVEHDFLKKIAVDCEFLSGSGESFIALKNAVI